MALRHPGVTLPTVEWLKLNCPTLSTRFPTPQALGKPASLARSGPSNHGANPTPRANTLTDAGSPEMLLSSTASTTRSEGEALWLAELPMLVSTR